MCAPTQAQVGSLNGVFKKKNREPFPEVFLSPNPNPNVIYGGLMYRSRLHVGLKREP